MREPKPDWYKKTWSLDIKEMSWVEETESQVDFLIKTMRLAGSERILDLACGFGRHSIALAERGFRVTGVDITPEYIEDAARTARTRGLSADFICSDIRDIGFSEKFDVVLNMADGAVGYLENDVENLKIFDRIAAALKPGGKHFMDVCSRAHAERCFPKRTWEIGSHSVSLAQFSWNPDTKRMLYGGFDIPFGKTAQPPASIDAHSSIRLYDKEELRQIMADRGMALLETFSDYRGTPDSPRCIQLMAYSVKRPDSALI